MKIEVPAQITPAEDLRRVHFIGLGGAALSGIATIMAERGIVVTGSDNNDTPFLARLRELGVAPNLDYRPEHVGAADVVVVTTAAREDNPEVVEATRRGLTLWPRSAGLASVMADQRVLAVAGTHGKTTTTSLLTVALIAAGADPSYAVGGVLSATGRNAHWGSGDLFVAEADESDGAFLVYTPYAAIVTNVDADHLDIWGTEERYQAAFVEFLDRVDPEGFLVCCVDDPGAAQVASVARQRGLEVIAVGTGADADVVVGTPTYADGVSRATLSRGPEQLGELRLRIPGTHYLLDAAAACAVGLRLGFDFDQLTDGMAEFTGTQRRMEAKGTVGGVRVVDSYAHHPAEIRGDLQAARALAGSGRVVVIFQPHLVSRTRIFGAEMGRELSAADEVIVLDVYVAREDPDPEVTGRLVADAVDLPAAAVAYAPRAEDAVAEALRRARPGDVVVTLGAGDVTSLGPVILQRLADG